MKYYQFSLRRKDKGFVTSDITNKDITNPPFIIDDKVSILEWYEQNEGKELLMVSGLESTLVAFKDGLELGLKSEELLK